VCVIRPVAPEDVMHLMDELQRAVELAALAALLVQPEEIADSEGIGPEVAARWRRSGEAGGDCELIHQLPGQAKTRALIHALSQSP
jgi:hypothetical protein